MPNGAIPERGSDEQRRLHAAVRGMLFGLVVQYALGMTLAMFGLETAPDRTLFAGIILGLHALVGVALLIGAFRISMLVRRNGNVPRRRWGSWGLSSILLAFLGGILTVVLTGVWAEFASLLMAFSFLSAFASYGYLFFMLRVAKS